MSERRRVLSATFTGHTRVPTLGQVEIATASPTLSLFCDGSELLMAYREAGQPRLEAVPVNSGAVLRIVYEGDETLAPVVAPLRFPPAPPASLNGVVFAFGPNFIGSEKPSSLDAVGQPTVPVRVAELSAKERAKVRNLGDGRFAYVDARALPEQSKTLEGGKVVTFPPEGAAYDLAVDAYLSRVGHCVPRDSSAASESPAEAPKPGGKRRQKAQEG